MQTANHDSLSREGPAIPQSQRIRAAAPGDALALAPGIFEAPCQHPAQPAVRGTGIRIGPALFRLVQELEGGRDPSCGKFLKSRVKANSTVSRRRSIAIAGLRTEAALTDELRGTYLGIASCMEPETARSLTINGPCRKLTYCIYSFATPEHK